MDEILLTAQEAAALIGKSRMCITQWQTNGRTSIGKLARYHIDEIAKRPADFGVTAGDVDRFRETHHGKQKYVILRHELIAYAKRVPGQGYPAGRPRRGYI